MVLGVAVSGIIRLFLSLLIDLPSVDASKVQHYRVVIDGEGSYHKDMDR